ncbi:protein phosphatase 1 regulatory subunit 12A isoform X1 [Drosophila yakuba]|uniref:protein phosphatase 1 regulatory subunit 12A isoform X1 n=1 Tax=Drosophila yakuba TaxID=7245 RepID=UPI0019307A81|nr:protein phosphatase 1 regulatory subunit 12A isoform X1 [Drosophila yakuba]XP_039230668.1 protein phosphatase 1 regulatory subunit 12A isoform X1 [Drosophila yakuba]XP_039230669.1 protein phosphatase 1 regulatory subunit 12A isoform X1 [Drosophila yakuba]
MSSLDARNNSAMMKRAEQLKRWEESDTNRAAPTPRHEHGRRIKFSSGCVFLAACLSGDKDEVVQLLDQGADINTANVDGLTALHQACIDDNLDMVEFLVERGADINRQDNEGWTPLHATASCGFVSIARYLVENGADVAAVNSDGDLALDLAIDVQHMAMIDYMEKMVQELNINVDEARKAEEQAMLNDAKKWLRSDAAEVDRPHPKTGATALHVAAAKGYTKVLGLLLAGRGNVDRQDNDGWTPLHAASHWGQRETAEMLVESLADMDIRNYAGQSCIDVADRKIVKFLEELRANKRNKRRPSSQISRISDAMENHVDKTPTKLVRVEVRTDATKDAASGSSKATEADSSIPSAAHDDVSGGGEVVASGQSDTEELSDSTESSHLTSLSESEAENVKPNQQIHAVEHPVEEEAPWRRKLPRTPNDSPTNNQVPDRELSSNSSETANDVILRRTQSFENDQKFYQKYNELRARIKANSCPILPANANASAAAANKSNNNNNLSSNNYHNNNNNNNKSDLLLGYAAGATTTTSTSTTTTTTSSTFNNTHSNTNNTSTTQQPQQQPAAASAANQLYSVQRSASLKDNSMYYRKPTITIATPTSTASTAINSPSTTVQTPPIRSQVTAKIAEKSNNGSSSTASVSDAESSKPPPKQSASNMIKNFFKSFVPPVRDEESETQRKAHAKRVRETRRSTQGVTLDEIKSAEELVKKKNMGMANNNNNNNISTTTTNTISNSGNETSSASSTSAPTPSILGSNEQQDELQPPPPPTTPPPAIIPTTTTATDETEIEEVVSNPSTGQSQNDTTASFTLSAPVRRSLSADREADANSDPEGDQDQTVVSASYTIMPRRERLPESSENVESIRSPQKTDPVAKTASEEQAEEPPHARPTDLPLIPAPAAPSTEAIKSSSAATTPAALESPVRLRDKRGLAGSGSQESETKSDTASPVSSHPDFNARDSLLSLYARRTTDSSAGGGGGGAGAAGGAASSSSTSAAERRPSWRLKFDAGSKFKLEDITSGGTYPPNNSTIIPSAPAVMAAANLSTTTGVQRRISSGPNALNASNQSLNSVGRPVSAPSEGTNNSAYFTPSARKFETNATPTGATTAANSTSNSTSNSVSATNANHTAATAQNATSNHDDKDNDKENDNRTQTVIQRRRKPKRRSTGVVHIDMDELDPERQNESSNNDNEEKEKESGSERTSRSRLGSTASTATTSESKSSSSNDKTENGDSIDYKALWEAEKLENDKLRQMLKQKDDEALQTRATLERFANATTKNSLSELEKRERRAMERKLSELEEELKLLQKLKTENDRLRAENRALTRVVSKLTTSAQSQLAKTK